MFNHYFATILCMTFITMAVYGYDSSVSVGRWKHDSRPRVPEYILLTLAALGGSFGAWVMMVVERHKSGSRKKKHLCFRVVTYSSMIMHFIVFVILFVTDGIGG